MVKGVEPLAGITDARGAVFVDLDEDGTLDVMVQRTGVQGEGRVLFVQNNFYYDAFFMKAIRTAKYFFFPLFIPHYDSFLFIYLFVLDRMVQC